MASRNVALETLDPDAVVVPLVVERALPISGGPLAPTHDPREKKHAPIGPDATPELHQVPRPPPEPVVIQPGGAELPEPPTPAPEPSPVVTPPEERPSRPPQHIPKPHIRLRSSASKGPLAYRTA